MKKTELYRCIREGRFDEALEMLAEVAVPKYGSESVTGPKDLYEIVKEYGFKRKEHFIVILLNGAHKCIAEQVISVGLVNRTVVHPREVFYPAIIKNATSIVVCHNHPSGNTDPSPEDIDITKRLREAGDLLGINVLDHLIISSAGYYSFAEHGLIEVGI